MKKLLTTLTTLCICGLICSQAYSATMTLQPGPNDGKDAYIYSSAPNNNYSNSNLYVYDDKHYIRSLLEFDISALPANATITSAIMQLYVAYGNHAAIRVYQITQPWDEATVTWNNQPLFDGSTTYTAFSTTGWTSWDITTFVNSWYIGASVNNGVELMSVDYDQQFYSSEFTANSTVRPKLTITYDQSTIPEPSTLIMLLTSALGLFIKRIRR